MIGSGSVDYVTNGEALKQGCTTKSRKSEVREMNRWSDRCGGRRYARDGVDGEMIGQRDMRKGLGCGRGRNLARI